MKITDVTIIKRDVTGKLIPGGEDITLIPGTEVLITQSKGTSFTLNVNGNLVRIDGKEADAIGKEPPQMPADRLLRAGEKISEKMLWEQLKTCYDPEIPVNIVDLGLVYEVTLTPQDNSAEASSAKDCPSKNASVRYHVDVVMTLTAPGCGMGPVLQQDVIASLKAIPGVVDVDVLLVFDPPWHSDLMTDEAKLELGIF